MIHSFGITLLGSAAKTSSLMMEKMVVSKALTGCEEHTGFWKVTVSGEEGRAIGKVRSSEEKPDAVKIVKYAAGYSSTRCSAAQRAKKLERQQAGASTVE